MSEWQKYESLQDKRWMYVPSKQFILVEGSQYHSGHSWRRIYASEAYIDGSNPPFYYNQKDLDRIMERGGMDFIERIAYWMPFKLPQWPDDMY